MMEMIEKGVDNNDNDGVVIGLQENYISALNYRIILFLKSLFHEKMDNVLMKVFGGIRMKKKEKYTNVISESCGGIYISVWLKDKLIKDVKDVRVDKIACGTLGFFPNKGASAIRFKLFESDFCFINSHLIHGKKRVKRRNSSYKLIENRINFQNKELMNCKNHDVLFWLGDLNYRINLVHKEVIKNLPNIKSLLHFDQLTIEKEKKTAFQDYDESEITFEPTYKYKLIIGQDLYVTNRTPSYTDRILWKRSDLIQSREYKSLKSFVQSDHKPVMLICSVEVRVKIPGKYETVHSLICEEFDKIQTKFNT